MVCPPSHCPCPFLPQTMVCTCKAGCMTADIHLQWRWLALSLLRCPPSRQKIYLAFGPGAKKTGPHITFPAVHITFPTVHVTFPTVRIAFPTVLAPVSSLA
eukprot:167560-Chlamydomonas_euryale.AAC.1